MDQSTYQKLTGEILTDAQATRFTAVEEVARRQLEEMLGWPLNPTDWDNQYVERGKSRSTYCSPEILDDDLDAPDAVVGKYRLFPVRHSDRILVIDPATEIHSIKFVISDVTCETLEADEYHTVTTPGLVPFIKQVRLNKCWADYNCACSNGRVQVAVDAEWAFALNGDDVTLPLSLQFVLADIVKGLLDTKADIQSENITSYSYRKFAPQDVGVKHQATLLKYAGPNGTAKRSRIV